MKYRSADTLARNWFRHRPSRPHRSYLRRSAHRGLCPRHRHRHDPTWGARRCRMPRLPLPRPATGRCWRHWLRPGCCHRSRTRKPSPPLSLPQKKPESPVPSDADAACGLEWSSPARAPQRPTTTVRVELRPGQRNRRLCQRFVPPRRTHTALNSRMSPQSHLAQQCENHCRRQRNTGRVARAVDASRAEW